MKRSVTLTKNGFIAAEKFGWTPEQVDEQPAYLIDWILSIGVIVDEVKANKSDSK